LYVASGRSKGAHTGPSPVDRARPGNKYHLIVDRHGTPLAASLTSGNRQDVTQLMLLLDAIPRLRGVRRRPRHRPGRLFADRGYDYDKYRRLLRARGITPRIACKGTVHGPSWAEPAGWLSGPSPAPPLGCCTSRGRHKTAISRQHENRQMMLQASRSSARCRSALVADPKPLELVKRPYSVAALSLASGAALEGAPRHQRHPSTNLQAVGFSDEPRRAPRGDSPERREAPPSGSLLRISGPGRPDVHPEFGVPCPLHASFSRYTCSSWRWCTPTPCSSRRLSEE
jgi:hypothetical protein